jgi:hypothetical protein
MRHLLVMLSVLLMPVAGLMPQSARAQTEATLACTTSQKSTERWRTREYRGTSSHLDYRNTCTSPVKFYYCINQNPDRSSCSSVAHFQLQILQPGETTRLSPTTTNVTQYFHTIQCANTAQLADWKSQFSEEAGPRCKNPLPANVNRAPYPGTGNVAVPSAPAAKLRNGDSMGFDVEYPVALWDTLAEGDVSAIIAVGANGRAKGCQITRSSGFFDFDKATCDVFMRRGYFSPAKGVDGTAVDGITKVRLIIPAP